MYTLPNKEKDFPILTTGPEWIHLSGASPHWFLSARATPGQKIATVKILEALTHTWNGANFMEKPLASRFSGPGAFQSIYGVQHLLPPAQGHLWRRR